MKTLKVVPGTVVVLDALDWREPAWEFDHPSAILSPVVRTWESGQSIESIVEELCIDACVDGELRSEPIEGGVVGRRWRVATLRRRFREALAGGHFPATQDKAERVTVRFFTDADGELAFEVVSRAAVPPPSGEPGEGEE